MPTNSLPFSLALAGAVLAFFGGFLVSKYTGLSAGQVQESSGHSQPPLAAPAPDVTRKGSEDLKETVEKSAGDETSGESSLAGHMRPLGSHRRPTNHVDVLNLIPSSEDFYRLYVRPRKAVLLRGGARSWPAFKHWSDEDYLRRKFGDTKLKVEMRKRYDNDAFVKKVMNLSDFLDVYRTQEVYLDSPYVRSEMMADVLVPPCLACPELLKTVGPRLPAITPLSIEYKSL